MEVLGLTPEKITKMSPEELKNLGSYLKKIYNIPENNLDARLVDNIDHYEPVCKKNWKESIKDMANYITKGKSTLPIESMNLAGEIIGNYLSICVKIGKIKRENIGILDPLAGNGVASKIICNKIKEKIPNIKYTASDIQILTDVIDSNSIEVEFDIDCVDSICKYNSVMDVLLLVCPPPCSFIQDDINNKEPMGFVDYYAIKKWTELGKKFLVYIGEMGFSDGTSGMYHYMLNHSVWKLKYRKVLIEKEDLFGRLIKKEIFIFENENV